MVHVCAEVCVKSGKPDKHVGYYLAVRCLNVAKQFIAALGLRTGF